MLLVGTDEAGYGPNLGPLLVSATAWKCSADPAQLDLEHLLDPLGKNNEPKLQIPVADSKQLFASQTGLRRVEQTLFTFLALQDRAALPSNWTEIWNLVAAQSTDQFASLPWYEDCVLPVPRALQLEDLVSLVARATDFFAPTPIEFLSVSSVSIEPPRFNQLCAELGNKSSLLTDVTLKLVRQTIEQHFAQPALVVCDKHGGRNRYTPALQTIFPEHLIRVVEEGPDISIYRTMQGEFEIEFRFVVKGERNFPVALASMFSKYLRELAMLAFNQFWKRHVPELTATAGYPVDAKRFRKEIENTASRLRISDEQFWRKK